MDLIILGAGTALPTRDKGPSGFWVREGDTSILVDCGSGTLHKLIRARGDLAALDAILLTHAHLDHLSDFPAILFAMKALGSIPPRVLKILHSPGLTPYLDGLKATFGEWLVPGAIEVQYQVVVPGQPLTVGPLKVTPFEVSHHPSSLGYLIADSANARLAIPGDTALCQSLVDRVQHVDCLVMECAATDEAPLEGHLSPRDVLTVLERSRPLGLVLTHIHPDSDCARVLDPVLARATCPTVVARDGMALDVRRGGFVTLDEDIFAVDRVLGPEEGDLAGPATGVGSAPVHASTDDLASMRQLLERELGGLDPLAMTRRKYDREVRQPALAGRPASHDEWGFERRAAQVDEWIEEDLVGLSPTREQRKLLKRASEQPIQSELNLRGSLKAAGLARLEAVIPTWAQRGIQLGLIVTGKGKQSVEEPVLKLAVLNWLTGARGQRWVKFWAPVITADGNFGSLVVELRTSRRIPS